MIWKLVIRRIATLQEISTSWTVRDLLLANDALEMQDDLDERASTQPKEA